MPVIFVVLRLICMLRMSGSISGLYLPDASTLVRPGIAGCCGWIFTVAWEQAADHMLLERGVRASHLPSWPSVAFSVKTSDTLMSPRLSSSMQAVLWIGLVQPWMLEPPETLHLHPLSPQMTYMLQSLGSAPQELLP